MTKIVEVLDGVMPPERLEQLLEAGLTATKVEMRKSGPVESVDHLVIRQYMQFWFDMEQAITKSMFEAAKLAKEEDSDKPALTTEEMWEKLLADPRVRKIYEKKKKEAEILES